MILKFVFLFLSTIIIKVEAKKHVKRETFNSNVAYKVIFNQVYFGGIGLRNLNQEEEIVLGKNMTGSASEIAPPLVIGKCHVIGQGKVKIRRYRPRFEARRRLKVDEERYNFLGKNKDKHCGKKKNRSLTISFSCEWSSHNASSMDKLKKSFEGFLKWMASPEGKNTMVKIMQSMALCVFSVRDPLLDNGHANPPVTSSPTLTPSVDNDQNPPSNMPTISPTLPPTVLPTLSQTTTPVISTSMPSAPTQNPSKLSTQSNTMIPTNTWYPTITWYPTLTHIPTATYYPTFFTAIVNAPTPIEPSNEMDPENHKSTTLPTSSQSLIGSYSGTGSGTWNWPATNEPA